MRSRLPHQGRAQGFRIRNQEQDLHHYVQGQSFIIKTEAKATISCPPGTTRPRLVLEKTSLLLDSFTIKSPRSGWIILSDRAKFVVALSCISAKIQNSAAEKFCPRTHRIYMPSVINVGPAVSEPQSFANATTARTHGHTGIWPVLQVISGKTTNKQINSHLAQDGMELLCEPTANLCPPTRYIQHCYMQAPERRM